MCHVLYQAVTVGAALHATLDPGLEIGEPTVVLVAAATQFAGIITPTPAPPTAHAADPEEDDEKKDQKAESEFHSAASAR
jgi:hypothetical protein